MSRIGAGHGSDSPNAFSDKSNEASKTLSQPTSPYRKQSTVWSLTMPTACMKA